MIAAEVLVVALPIVGILLPIALLVASSKVGGSQPPALDQRLLPSTDADGRYLRWWPYGDRSLPHRLAWVRWGSCSLVGGYNC